MSAGGADGQAQNSGGAVGCSFPGQHQLAQRAAAQEQAGKAGQAEAQSIPKGIVVSDGLTFKTQTKENFAGEGAQEQVAQQSPQENGAECFQQTAVFKKQPVSDAAHEAETAPLCRCPGRKTQGQTCNDGSMQGAGPVGAEADKSGLQEQKSQKTKLYDREPTSFQKFALYARWRL